METIADVLRSIADGLDADYQGNFPAATEKLMELAKGMVAELVRQARPGGAST